jgi:ABC-type Fe3+-hydroxamate transport system substrate-binding protein
VSRLSGFTDQMGRTVSISFPPRRIISLVPSQTELLFDLGLDEQIAAITKFCIHPAEKFRQKIKVGGTKKLDMGAIRAIDPDLIIGNKEENEQKQMEELMKEFPVWMSDIGVLEDALEMIKLIGDITGREAEAASINGKILQGFGSLDLVESHQKVAYLIWKEPYMLAGKHTFIDDMLRRAGFSNISRHGRYPEMSAKEIRRADPDLIFLSSEPYPFKESHIAEFSEICPHAEIRVVDGEMFSWYGSRLIHVPPYIRSLRSGHLK